uniref:ELM2 domain-containing protein n=1 Tax=Caenorhabditis tropicalis TaxID=1561998 RepID=A0A1I7UII1_9PELO
MDNNIRPFSRPPSEEREIQRDFECSSSSDLSVGIERGNEPVPDDPKASSPPERHLQPTAMVTDASENREIEIPQKSTTPEDPMLKEPEPMDTSDESLNFTAPEGEESPSEVIQKEEEDKDPEPMETSEEAMDHPEAAEVAQEEAASSEATSVAADSSEVSDSSEAAEADSAESEAPESEAPEPEAAEAEAAEFEVPGAPEAHERSESPKSTSSESEVAQSDAPEGSEGYEAADSKPASPEATERNAAESEALECEMAETEIPEAPRRSESPESKASESEVAEFNAPECSDTPDSKEATPEATESNFAEFEAPEPAAAEFEAPELASIEFVIPEIPKFCDSPRAKSPESEAVESDAPEDSRSPVSSKSTSPGSEADELEAPKCSEPANSEPDSPEATEIDVAESEAPGPAAAVVQAPANDAPESPRAADPEIAHSEAPEPKIAKLEAHQSKSTETEDSRSSEALESDAIESQVAKSEAPESKTPESEAVIESESQESPEDPEEPMDTSEATDLQGFEADTAGEAETEAANPQITNSEPASSKTPEPSEAPGPSEATRLSESPERLRPIRVSICQPLLSRNTSEVPEDQTNEDPISIQIPEVTEPRRGTRRTRKRAAPEISPVPVRQSRRKRDEAPVLVEEEKEEEIIPQKRGVIPPLGTTRIPFQFNSKPRKEKERLKAQLKIDMETNFKPVARQMRVAITAVKKPKKEGAEPTVAQKDTPRIPIPVGEAHQAVLPDYCTDEDRSQIEEKEECFWSPPTTDRMRQVIHRKLPLPDPEVEDTFYREVENIALRAVWRQFESHIPMHFVLRTIMECDYDVCESLNYVEKCLEELPQKMKPLCMAQAKLLYNMMRNKKISRRKLQEKTMRNYHIGEVHLYLVQFRRFYKRQEKIGVPCNCDYEMCHPILYEPQYGCKNCSKKVRDTSEYSTERKCVLCKVYWHVNGRERNAKKIWNDEEEFLMRRWTEEEEKQGKSLGRLEFLEILQLENNERWMRNELTAEEKEMLDHKELAVPNRQSTRSLTEAEQKAKNEKICKQLQPLVLPHFTECRCKISGEISRLSPNIRKTRFSKEEKDKFSKAIAEADGDVEAVAHALDCEEQLVEIFLNTFKEKDPIWRNLDAQTCTDRARLLDRRCSGRIAVSLRQNQSAESATTTTKISAEYQQ